MLHEITGHHSSLKTCFIIPPFSRIFPTCLYFDGRDCDTRKKCLVREMSMRWRLLRCSPLFRGAGRLDSGVYKSDLQDPLSLPVAWRLTGLLLDMPLTQPLHVWLTCSQTTYLHFTHSVQTFCTTCGVPPSSQTIWGILHYSLFRDIKQPAANGGTCPIPWLYA